jgi:alkaline phosphatase D
MEANEHSLPKDRSAARAVPRRSAGGGKPDWTYNMLLKHGVRSCLEYAKSFDLKRAHAVSNPELSAPRVRRSGRPRLCDGAAHRDEMRTEFVCIPRPITRSERDDGGPLRYRVVHTAALWR